ncbi:MAG: arginine--tRNA ligase, partial [Candidatus Omnitrophica bacterium]|nr:arginine--tRNA ligase [Candidatus Omnitrophota bacterium]
PSYGDLSSPVAFKLASHKRQAPPQIASQLIEVLQDILRRSALKGCVERFEARQGFVNLFLSQRALTGIVTRINRDKTRYGRGNTGEGRRVLIEFVSANPTGPLSVAHGRQAAVGDALARVLRSQGYRVTAEYYLNDEGRQIEMLGRSLRARYLERCGIQEPFPEDGYHGDYLVESAGVLQQRHGETLRQKPLDWFIEQGVQEQLSRIERDLAQFGLTFDRWSSQRRLRTSGRIDRALNQLKSRGVLYDAEGATWFASSRFGDDKDRVVRKQSGELTYLAPDIAYHEEKFRQGYARLINLWGPDHHGYIPRLKAAMTALGFPEDRLVIRIVQLVTLSRQGKPVPMSKRQGEFVTFREILDEVGVDATRFFYLGSIVAYARQQLPWIARIVPSDLSRLVEPEERLLLRQLFQFPLMLKACATSLEPHGITVYLQKLAELFHVFYGKHRVVSEDAALSRARLDLVGATRWVLANGLGLLGVSAPKRM